MLHGLMDVVGNLKVFGVGIFCHDTITWLCVKVTFWLLNDLELFSTGHAKGEVDGASALLKREIQK